MSASKARVGEEYVQPPSLSPYLQSLFRVIVWLEPIADISQNMEVRNKLTSYSKPNTAPPSLHTDRLSPSRRTRIDKVNSELVVLTYGTIVAQLCKDFDSDYVEVNKQLDKMGYNIGLRLIEDYLAKSNTMKRCANFRETAEMISKVRVPLLPAVRAARLTKNDRTQI